MPTHLHEAIAQLLIETPQVTEELLSAALGWNLPEGVTAIRADASLADAIPAEYRADGIILLKAPAAVVAALVLEVQLRPDDEKHWSWPAYLALTRRRYRCRADVLVVTVDDATARWAAEAVALGEANSFRPLVIGPDNVPRLESVEAAQQHPELAVLSALAHRSAGDLPLQLAVNKGLSRSALDGGRIAYYNDLILASLGGSLRAALEAVMQIPKDYVPQSEYSRRLMAALAEGEAKGKAEGKAEGLRAALETLLKQRGLVLSPSQSSMLATCDDAELLNTWFARAVGAVDVDAIFSSSN